MQPPSFEAMPGNPVPSPSKLSSDAQFMMLPDEVEDGGQYYSFYTRSRDLMSEPLSIGLAISKDEEIWRPFAGRRVLSGDGSGYNAGPVGSAKIFREDQQ